MRLAPKEYRTEALHVDVFFLIGSPEDPAERKAFAAQVKKVSRARYGKLVKPWEEATGDIKQFLFLALKRKLPVLFKSLAAIDKEYRSLCRQYPTEGATYCISADNYADWRDYPSKLMWKTKVVETSFGEIRVPVHYDELLRIMYGDYMKVPPIEERIKEVMYNYHRIITFTDHKT